MEYRCSAETFENFLESPIWGDLSDELDRWLEDIRDTLEGINKRDDVIPLTHEQLQGAAYAVRYIKLLPENVLGNIIEDNERKENENAVK